MLDIVNTQRSSSCIKPNSTDVLLPSGYVTNIASTKILYILSGSDANIYTVFLLSKMMGEVIGWAELSEHRMRDATLYGSGGMAIQNYFLNYLHNGAFRRVS